VLIPHLHFGGGCADAIALYEKAFGVMAGGFDYRDGLIAHAEMDIHGQRVFLNDAFGNKQKTGDCGAVHLVLTFGTAEELLACYEILRDEGDDGVPFVKTPYSALCGNFMDKFGVLWGFMAEKGDE